MASEAHELRHGIILDGPSAVGWDEACPINETLDGSGNPPPPELQGFGQADPSSVGMTRSRDDPKVQALREYLKENNGIKGERLRLRGQFGGFLIGTLRRAGDLRAARARPHREDLPARRLLRGAGPS